MKSQSEYQSLALSATAAPPAPDAPTVPSPGPTPAPISYDGLDITGWIGIVLSASVVAAFVSGWVSVWLARRKGREEERSRIRDTFAEAFQTYADYKEFPYAVRRRDAARPAEERLRLSESMRAVQSRLSYYESWTTLESPTVGEAYATMVKQLRIVAGGAVREAWAAPGVSDDADMNIPLTRVDLTSLTPYEHAYREAVAKYLRALATRRF